MINQKICPEDLLRVLMMVESIPDQAIVSKRTGEQTFVLRHDLKVYPIKEAKGLPQEAMKITGYFIVNERGDVNQVASDTFMHWHVTAEDLLDVLQRSWHEETPQ